MRVLFTSTPGLGHTSPLAPFASAVLAAGHQVVWASADESCDRLRGLGFEAIAAGMGVRERRAGLEPQMPEIMALEPRERRARVFAGYFGEIAAPRMHVELGPVFESFQPDLVIHEIAELAAAPIAVARGLPHVTVAFSGALAPAVVAMTLGTMASMWSLAGVTAPGVDEMLGSMYVHPFPSSFGGSPTHGDVRLVRPEAVSGREAHGVPEWLESLGTDRPLVYMTAGSEVAGTTAPWAAALEAMAALDVDVVATIGPILDPETLGVLPENVRVERFVPQHLLLDRASVVASHGGAGTVLGAAAHGVPQLLFPIAADQWENADAVARAGAGVVCELERRSADDLGSGLQRLLQDESMRECAATVASEISGMPAAADHMAALEALVG